MRRIVLIIALVVGIDTFCIVLLCFPVAVWFAISPIAGGEFDLIGLFLVIASIIPYVLFWPLAATGLVLSIVTLFIERNKCLRLLPLAFVLAGICLFAALRLLEDFLMR